MVFVVVLFASCALSCTLATLGAVLLASWWAAPLARAAKVAGSAFVGASIAIVPLVLFDALPRRVPSTQELIAAGVLLVIVFAIVGLPVAHFALRRLERSAGFDTRVFE